MSITDADGVRQITRDEWDALSEQRTRVLAENAKVRGEARQARSEAVEQRLRTHDRLERDSAAVDRDH